MLHILLFFVLSPRILRINHGKLKKVSASSQAGIEGGKEGDLQLPTSEWCSPRLAP
ncbi:hypothetical protein SERLA73DRAFT_146123 [Serpula lacrymans var. lacrymans S7.3]|uniref:Uncharacterized protein n=2 Tax=Serpula lacrymans var. lacrymans TaxID=341189 RepID=F8QF37_SERL3|nr:uncharacterized protein SERLADRAFT_383439 [Serpula lacrymans var. lacrymans S7.9]EGN92996.1 hypothetical protein SERLA73DRAFT_146123 [Serpula lacrymans var. lacrymans S7.3]EGO27830.1 hypothetical protein SERLADRAFT_383439 [Serpula lacrymans var. lacrymans S7.9]